MWPEGAGAALLTNRRDFMRRAVAVVVVALAGFLISTRAQASELYSIDAFAELYQVSQTSGSATVTGTGTVSPFQTRDLASDTRPGSYRLWTTSADQLVSINPTTGEGTVVGRFNTPLSGMRTLAFDIVTGKLYGMDGAPAA